MALNIDSLERSNLAERVADLLRESIVNGQISTGTHLIEAEIAKQLNVSRGPLREAFRILETEGPFREPPWPGNLCIPAIRTIHLRGIFITQSIRRRSL
jgi:DNA-binding transcriptional MocR family regulator